MIKSPALIALSLLFSACAIPLVSFAQAEAPAAPKPVATVDGVEITQNALLNRFRLLLQRQLGQRAASIPPEQYPQMLAQLPPEQRERMVSSLIDEQLLTAAADAANVEVPADAIDAQLQGIPIPEGITLEGFLMANGTSLEAVRAEITKNLKLNALVRSKTEGKIKPPTETEVKAYYDDNPDLFQSSESVRARHILIKSEDAAGDTGAREKIDAIRERVVGESAEDFAEVAKETSEGPSGPRGGDLGEFGRGQMVPTFDKVAFELPVGDVSEPVATQFGWHLIKVEDKTEAGTQPLDDELKGQIAAQLQNEAQQEIVEAYLAELREEAEVVRN